MIYKSYLVEKNFEVLKNKVVLFYGENYGIPIILKVNKK